jgi:hypothetical protein
MSFTVKKIALLTLQKQACTRKLWGAGPQVEMYCYLLPSSMFIFNYALQPFKAYCGFWIRRSNFRPQASPRESTQRRKVELWARNVREFCLNFDFHVTFRDLSHAVKPRHGTDGFTSPPKEGVMRIFSPQKSNGFGRVRNRELGYHRPLCTSAPTDSS